MSCCSGDHKLSVQTIANLVIIGVSQRRTSFFSSARTLATLIWDCIGILDGLGMKVNGCSGQFRPLSSAIKWILFLNWLAFRAEDVPGLVQI